ncbi:plasmid maintenance system killer protein [Stappia sp. GBMRC 2046]|uniref:Plasmid maintenance system killer protein n=1 Tax=Stappia sediminis TaxID=2692190 RepID=A0A7X3SA28_9HYPH|nr:type II toxin-antitoxin system RelE/ParE family toxin [Stappia sediminis]MXN67472.1 plasmid maintenance system killer protein [Stappia sediminis]
MIKSFGDEETERFFNEGVVPPTLRQIENPALRKLRMLDSAESIVDISKVPGNRLEKIKSKPGKYSIRVNDQYRVTFYWEDGGPTLVRIVDYH